MTEEINKISDTEIEIKKTYTETRTKWDLEREKKALEDRLDKVNSRLAMFNEK